MELKIGNWELGIMIREVKLDEMNGRRAGGILTYVVLLSHDELACIKISGKGWTESTDIHSLHVFVPLY